MKDTVRDVMTEEPVKLSSDTPLVHAARVMREENIGDVLITDDGKGVGILTDRDVVVRGLAEGRDPEETTVGEICSRDVVTCSPDAGIDEAVQKMRENAVRRLVVVDDNDEPVGILSIGDLAIERDRRSALGEISAAPPNQ